ncbi:tautomerase family protein [Histidinibacterium aquaticum]|uniref:4-oxalocrotonate tautomerase n=1 Tax=Histidinibacterium aquaticum TaxID=2613962 RepID=A0A5J5GBY6_9RHOB|nr:tautomerase family protein [Histidinibacterium aquaticum]KAA9005666.1 4-oxalocrotonate tautomerase [Histidinibacterium aquaticum]
MPLVDIELIEGAFDDEEKQRMIREVTEAIVAVEGEALRGVTWVRVREVASGDWAIGGRPMTAADVRGARAEHA